MRRSLPTVILLLLALLAPAAAAAQDDAVTMNVAAGFDGFFQDETWLPLTVTVANDGDPVTGSLRVLSGSNVANRVDYRTPIELPTQSRKRVTLYVFPAAISSGLTVELLNENDRVVAAAETGQLDRMQADDLLYGVAGPEPFAFDFLSRVSGRFADAEVAFLDLENLPAASAAWAPLDVLVLSGVDSGRLTPAQQRALRAWVSGGGQLVVTGGSNWQASTTGVADLLPVTVTGTRAVEELPALAGFTGVNVRDPGPYVVAENTLRAGGESILHEDGLPLLARRSYGGGNVYFLALDPALAPLLDWRGSDVLWEAVVARIAETAPWAFGPRNPFSAENAVTSLPQLQLPSTVWLALFMLGYTIVIGPANYLVLKRMGRRELAWVTIPALILLFAGAVYATGFRLRGDNIIVNQMAIAYGHTDGDEMRVNTLLGIYSPRRASYDVALPGDVLVRPYGGGGGIGGGDYSGRQEAIVEGQETVLDTLRIDASGIESYLATSQHATPAIDGAATLRLSSGDAELEVTIQNNSDLTLEHANLLFGSTLVTLGDLKPGESVQRSRRLTTSQATAAAGAVSGGFVGPTGAATLATHYNELLGTTNFYNDREVYPRFQLLESLTSGVGSYIGPSVTLPRDVVTLVAWSDEAPLEASVRGRPTETLGTTLYFLELPFNEVVAEGEGVTVPAALLAPRVIAERGVSVAGQNLTDIFLPTGWVELGFNPVGSFAGMEVTGFEVVLNRVPGEVSGPPRVALWHWENGVWDEIPNPVWGSMSVVDPAPYIGERNEVRLRLTNDANAGVSIREVYPRLTGDLR